MNDCVKYTKSSTGLVRDSSTPTALQPKLPDATRGEAMFRVYSRSALRPGCLTYAVLLGVLWVHRSMLCSPDSSIGAEYVSAHSERRVISYSLYGSDARYTAGAVENLSRLRTTYPGWEMRIYHDDSVPPHLLKKLSVRGAELVDMTGDTRNPMTWRFLVASDQSVSRWCSRDIDARLSVRERLCVDIWLTSGKSTHIIRDHPSHVKTPIMGGTWCGTNQSFPEMASLLESESIENRFNADQEFLAEFIWPRVKHDVLQHVSFGCDELQGSLPIPVRRSGLEHVGAVFINGKMRRSDLRLLAEAIQRKEECTL